MHERGKGRDGNKEKPAKADVEGKTAQAKAKNVEHADGGSDEGDEFNSAGTKVEDDKNMKASNSQEERISEGGRLGEKKDGALEKVKNGKATNEGGAGGGEAPAEERNRVEDDRKKE